ncbi:MAG TPA: amidohydrolase family protein, partial [Patescibacteria group bacterium]
MANKNNKLIKNTTVLFGQDLETISNVDILISGNTIKAVEKNIDAQDSEVIDGRHYLVCPSFVNAHLHLDDSAILDIGFGQTLEELVFPQGTRDKITAVNKEDTQKTIKRSLSQMIRSGTGLICSFCENGVEGVSLVKECLPSELKSVLVGRFKRKYPYESKVADLLNIADGFAPGFIKEISIDDLQNLSTDVKSTNGFIAMHSLESKGLPIENFYKAVDYLHPKFLVHLVQATDKEIKYLHNKNIGVVCCPRGNSLTGVGFPPILSLFEQGTTVALGTDNIFLNSPDMFREMEYTSRLLRGFSQNPSIISSRDILKMATINGAKVLGLDQQYGSVEPNKVANLIMFNLQSDNFSASADYL